MVLDGTLQVSWLLAAREGKMVGSLTGQLIRMSDSDSEMSLISERDSHLGREERPLDDAEGRMEELLSMSPAPTLIMLLLAEDIPLTLRG